MPINDEPDAYQTCVLRMWRTQVERKWQWRASLECPHTGERQVFGSLETLFAFLSERCADGNAGAAEIPVTPDEVRFQTQK
ncbi:MAG: hypothetical protein EHM65_07290 [Acidobacteriales bacterium]|nr:MAG: hypothetical protein EHM65_07290 [Terriglobales bacterium]